MRKLESNQRGFEENPGFVGGVVLAFYVVSDELSAVLVSCVVFLSFLQIGSERQYRHHLKVIDEFAYEVIRERRRRLEANPGSADGDVLSLFIKRAQQNNEELSERFLRDIVRACNLEHPVLPVARPKLWNETVFAA